MSAPFFFRYSGAMLDDLCRDLRSLGSGDKRHLGLVIPDLGLKRGQVARPDIRRIRYNDINLPANVQLFQRDEQVTFEKPDAVRYAMITGVLSGNRKGSLGRIGRDKRAPRSVFCQAYGDAAGAGAEIDDPDRPVPVLLTIVSAASTMNSVSGLGMSTSGVTLNSRPQNSWLPMIY